MRESEPKPEKPIPDPENLENLDKGKLIEIIKSLQERNKELEEQAKEFEKKIYELSHDGLTKLRIGRLFFTEINKRIEGIIENEELTELLEKEKFSEGDLTSYKRIPFYSIYMDMSYLSMYNKQGHDKGNIVLKGTAELIENGFRLGGDEFGQIFEGTDTEAQQEIEKFKKLQKKIKVPGFKIIESNADCGKAHLTEGIEAFLKVYLLDERKKMDGKEKSKKIQKLLTKIADLRSTTNKRIERLKLIEEFLRDKKKKAFVYTNLRSLTKCIEELSEGQISDIIEHIRNTRKVRGEGAVNEEIKLMLEKLMPVPEEISKEDEIAKEIALREI